MNITMIHYGLFLFKRRFSVDLGYTTPLLSLSSTLQRHIVRNANERANLAIEKLPSSIFVEWRAGFYGGIIYSNYAAELAISLGSKVMVGQNTLQPAKALI